MARFSSAVFPAGARGALLLGVLVLGSAACAVQAQTADGPQTGLPSISLAAGMHVIKAEVATTGLQRERGLMYRKSLGQNEGMLFVFDQPQQLCFWMKNTL